MAAKKTLEPMGFTVISVETEYPEIQADSSAQIASFSALAASKDLKVPVIREDHSLFLNSLNFPGPYMAYMEKQVPVDTLQKIVTVTNDRSGYFEIALVFAYGEFTKEFVFQVPIEIAEKEIVTDPRGGWNGILRFKNESRAFTEYPEEDRLEIWNKNYQKLGEYLLATDF